ncbi:ATP-binding protein [Spirochaetota bacterium]
MKQNLQNAKASKNEIEIIFENIKEGIFLLDPDLKISSEYSKALEDILQRSNLADMDFVSLFDNKLSEESIEVLKMFLKIHFKKEMERNVLIDLNPLSPVTYPCSDEKGNFKIKYLNFNFFRIVKGEGVSHLLASVADVTTQIQMELDLKAKKIENEENESLVSIFLEHGVGIFKNFIRKHQNDIYEAETVIRGGSKFTKEHLEQLGRVFHSLKGDSASINMNKISSLAHDLENTFILEIKDDEDVDPKHLNTIINKITNIKSEIKRINNKVSKMIGLDDEGEIRGGQKSLSVTVPIDKINKLIDTIKKDNGLKDQSIEIIQEMQALKKIPCNTLFKRFPNMVERLADKLGKKINPIIIEGGNILVDMVLLNTLGDSLVHMVRNSVDHAIELPEERKMKNKDEFGTIILSAAIKDNVFIISVKDDGQGINIEKLGKRCIAKGIMTKDKWDSMPLKKKQMMVFHPSLSSKEADNVTDLSGRGVGMDVVKNTVEELKGKTEIDSEQDVGTNFILSIPYKDET